MGEGSLNLGSEGRTTGIGSMGRDCVTLVEGIGEGPFNLGAGNNSAGRIRGMDRDGNFAAGRMGQGSFSLEVRLFENSSLGEVPFNSGILTTETSGAGSVARENINVTRGMEGGLVGWGQQGREDSLGRVEEVSCSVMEDDDISEASFDLDMGGFSSTVRNVMATGGMGGGASNLCLGREETGEGSNIELVGGRREGALGEGWEEEDHIRGQTIEELLTRAKSGKNFCVLLVRKIFARDQLIGRSVYGGRGAKRPLDRGILERIKGIYFSFFPADDKALAWKDCVKAINYFLRGRVNNSNSSRFHCMA